MIKLVRIYIHGEEVNMKKVREWCGEAFADELKKEIAENDAGTTIIYEMGEIEVYI